MASRRARIEKDSWLTTVGGHSPARKAHAQPHSGRALPLIALPILGVGQGKFPGRRAEVVRLLVAQLLSFVSSHPIDVALVLRRTSDFAAAEWARRQVANVDAACWPELTPDQLALADRLGKQAARGELSIFVGAGVSEPSASPTGRASSPNSRNAR